MQPGYARRGNIQLHDHDPGREELREAILRGLRQPRKQFPCALLYDRRGSELFEAITRLPEYYLTRVETAILDRYGDMIAQRFGSCCTLIEYGCGSLAKVRGLLERLQDVVAYVAVDISREALNASLRQLGAAYPNLPLIALCADYNRPLPIPLPKTPNRRVVLFFGSTIGNMEPDPAARFLRLAARALGPGDGLLIGVDLRKDVRILDAAYNDAAGVTAAFNLNVLCHLNDRFGANFDLSRFDHRAFFNECLGRVEMHLVSRCGQVVRVAGESFTFRSGETIHTENSYKHTVEGFRCIARLAGLEPQECWTDEQQWFSIHYLSVPQAAHGRP